ncbi:MAG: hypothetical protein RBT80_19680 [Candidatus Vecturithrix sp.]|jgi:hypothetical protein|nr:hypothetical protein [Candidatus Vecturithrix sp.]
MKIKLIIMAVVSILVLAGCAHYKTTLTNEKGETVVCEASGKTGPVSGSYLVRGYEVCVNAAKANGFKEVPQTSSNRK